MPAGSCVSTLVSSFHCGNDQQWSVLAPDEVDGPGVMWYNDSPCSVDAQVCCQALLHFVMPVYFILLQIVGIAPCYSLPDFVLLVRRRPSPLTSTARPMRKLPLICTAACLTGNRTGSARLLNLL